MGAARKALAGAEFNAKHPRGAGGKFVKKGGAAALLAAPKQDAAPSSPAQANVHLDALQGMSSRQAAGAHLGSLTVGQRTAVAEDLGIKGSGRYKKTQEAILDKLFPQAPGANTGPTDEPAPGKARDLLTRRIKQINEAIDEADLEGTAAKRLNDTRKRLVKQRAALGAPATPSTKTPSGARDTLKGTRGKANVADVMAAIAPIRANPQDGDRTKVEAILKPLTVAQLREVAASHGVTVLGQTKDDLRSNLVHGLVGSKLNSNAIRQASLGDHPELATPTSNQGQAGALTRRIKQIDEAMDEVDGRAAGQLNATRKELVKQRAALGPAQRASVPATSRGTTPRGKWTENPIGQAIAQAYANIQSRPHTSVFGDGHTLGPGEGAVAVKEVRDEMAALGHNFPKAQVDAELRRLMRGNSDGTATTINFPHGWKDKKRLDEYRAAGFQQGETVNAFMLFNKDRVDLPAPTAAGARGSTPSPRRARDIMKGSKVVPTQRSATQDMPDDLVFDIERDIRAAHLAAVSGPGRNEYSFFSEWRAPLDAKYGRRNVDAVIVDLGSGGSADPGFYILGETNQKTLTPERRAGAVQMGNQDNHLLSLRTSQNPAEPKLVPVRPTTGTPAAPPAKALSPAAQQWSEVLSQLRNATADDEQKVRNLLGTLSKDDLHEIAGELETATRPKKSASKAAHIDALVFGSVGFRERARAMGGFQFQSSQSDRAPATPRPTPALPSTPTPKRARGLLVPKVAAVRNEWTALPVAELTAKLRNVTADDETRVRGALEGRSKAELAAIVRQVDTVSAPSATTVNSLIEAIVLGTVGFRARARAMRS